MIRNKLSILSLLLGAALGHAQPANLEIKDSTITAAATYTASSRIVAGPNLTIASTGRATLRTSAAYFVGRVSVVTGGALFVVNPSPVAIRRVSPRSGLTWLSSVPDLFRGSMVLRYALSQAGPVEIAVYDVRGNAVRKLYHGRQAPGNHALIWDGRTETGAQAGSGIFYLQIRQGGQSVSRKITRMP